MPFIFLHIRKVKAMSYLIKFVIVMSLFNAAVSSFQCSRANGSYVNPDNYRTYYSCSNYCPTLLSCASHHEFYSRVKQTCVPEPADWQPRFDLTGSHGSPHTVFVRQDGYNVFYTIDTQDTDQTFIGRYVNETQVVGITWTLRKVNNCIYGFDAHMSVTANKAYCYTETLHMFSSKCGLPLVGKQACYKY